ncbi:hypothetical protein GCM10010353_50350 [Streptomyces chryseus]|nr:hypothetical protein GCM10010353_50350 [Streptomyces chryseus]
MSDSRHRFRLSFELIACLGCGVDRLRGQICADCGERPASWEVDQRSVYRRAAADAAITLLDTTEASPGTGPFGHLEMAQLLSRFETWLSAFLSAVRAVSEAKPGAEALLRSAVQDLVTDAALTASAPRRRPCIAIVDTARELTKFLVDMARAYLKALSASVPLEAQRHAATAQQHMDAAEICLKQYSVAMDLLTALIGSERLEDQVVVLLRESMGRLGAADLVDLSARAEAELANATGTAPRPGHGVGLHYALQDAAAFTYGDRSRFRQVVVESYRLFVQNPHLLSAMTSSPHFATDLEAALLDTFDASAQAVQAIGSGISRQVARSIVTIASSLVEGPGQLVAIALSAGTGRKTRPYEKLRQDDATGLLRSARGHEDLDPLLAGFNLDLRNAHSHGLVRYQEDGVATDTKSGPTFLGWDDLVDEVLTASESAMGCLVGLMHALSQLGVSVTRADGYRAIGITPGSLLCAAFTVMGCSAVTLDEQPDSWSVRLSAPSSTQLTVLLAGVAALVPGRISTLTLDATRPDGRHVLRGPTALLKPFSNAQDPDGDTYGIATVRLQRIWTHNGEPCIGEDVVRCWVARQVAAAFLADETRSIPRLRALRNLARDVGDIDLTDALTAAIRSARLGEDVDPHAMALTDRLAVWGSASFPYEPV